MEEASPAQYLNPGKAFLHAGCQWGLCEMEIAALVLTEQAHTFLIRLHAAPNLDFL